MSISKYCINDIVSEMVHNMNDDCFTTCMISEKELIYQLNSTIILDSSKRIQYDPDIYIISETYNNNVWTYHLKKTLQEKIRMSHQYLEIIKKKRQELYNIKIACFMNKFINRLNNINSWKVIKYMSYKLNTNRWARRKKRKFYYKLKYTTYRNTIMQELITVSNAHILN